MYTIKWKFFKYFTTDFIVRVISWLFCLQCKVCKNVITELMILLITAFQFNDKNKIAQKHILYHCIHQMNQFKKLLIESAIIICKNIIIELFDKFSIAFSRRNFLICSSSVFSDIQYVSVQF